MANKRIEIDVKVDDKGTTKKVGLGAKKAGEGLDSMAKGARDVERNTKGAAQASSNGTKNFSKMAQGAGGLVAAYATLAANIFAISAAYSFLKRAGDLVALTKGQEDYAYKTGRSMKLLTSRMQEATGGLLGFNEASQAAAIGTAAGISSDQLQGLAKIAKNASVALGRDLTDSFNRLTKGAIKAEPELLDELGIILRLEKASNDYARALDKNVDDLTTFEKSQAIVNAVLEQGNEKFDDVGDNINQVARLGKAFDDLVKKLMKFIEPAATFISGALADNVEALAAAFGLLGLSITRALAPAAPQMASIASMAAHSKEALMGAAGGGVTGQKIAGGDFSSGNLNAIDKGAGLKSGNSTVVNQMKMTEKEFKRHTAVIRADHARMVAANTRGFGSYYANFIAYLKGMEAEHGKTMGRIKAAGAVMAAGLGKVLNAVAIIGMISLAITMVKEFIEYFKDPALKKMQANAKSLTASYGEQNEEIKDMLANLKLSDVFSKRLTQQANMLSNQSFPAIKAMAESLKEATTVTETHPNRGETYTTHTGVIDPANTANLPAIEAATEAFRQQLVMLKDYNVESKAVEMQQERVLGIEQALAVVRRGLNPAVYKDDGRSIVEQNAAALEEYNVALNFLKGNLADTRAGASELSTVLSPDAAAISDIGEASKAFIKFRDGLKHTSSAYNTFIGFGERFSSQLEQLSSKSGDKTIGGSLSEEEIASFQAYLNIADEDIEKKLKGLTLDEAREKIAEKIADIRKDENTIEKGILTTKKTHLTNLKGQNKVETDVLNAKFKVSSIDAEILKAQQKINNEKGMGVKQDSTAIGIQEENILVLQAQRALEEELVTIKENQKEAATKIFELNTSSELRKGAEALLSLEEKRTSLAQQRADIEQKNNDRALSRASREFKNSSSFSSFFQEKFDADQKLNRALDVEEDNKKQIKLEFDMKEKLIAMEYELLEAKLSLLAEEMRMKAKDTKNYSPEQRQSFTDMAGNIDSQISKLPQIESAALEINKLLRLSSLEDLAENIDKLRDAKNDLSDINQLTTAISTSLVSGLGDAFQSMIDGTKSAKQAFADMAKSILTMISRMIIEMMVLRVVGSFFFGGGTSTGTPGASAAPHAYTNYAGYARNGGIFSNGAKVSGYSTGGVARGSTSGYPAMLHGTEAVVPLPNGKAIPVEMKGSGSTNNNIVVNVSTDGQTSKTDSSGPDMDKLGGAIAQAVQAELQNQKRSGGILNPYGAA